MEKCNTEVGLSNQFLSKNIEPERNYGKSTVLQLCHLNKSDSIHTYHLFLSPLAHPASSASVLGLSS